MKKVINLWNSSESTISNAGKMFLLRKLGSILACTNGKRKRSHHGSKTDGSYDIPKLTKYQCHK